MTDPTRPATLAGVLLTSVPVFLAWAFMKLLGRTWGDYGLKLAPLWKTVGLGIAIAAVLHMLVLFVLAPLIYRIAPDPPDISHLTGIRGDPAAFLFVMLVVWITAALFEELVFRGFLLNETATLLGRGTVGWIGAALFIAVTFGLGHAYQGLFGILITGSIGLLLAIAYLLVGRNLLPLILAHGLIDTYSISMLYLS